MDDAVHHVLDLGCGTLLSKLDLKDAYRFVLIYPHDIRLLAISWEGSVYIDRALPFRLRLAPRCSQTCWHGPSSKMVSPSPLSGFLFLCPSGTNSSIDPLPVALRVLDSLGIPVASHKVEGPSPVITFLGIQIDTLAMELRLPPQKVDHIADMVAIWHSKRSSAYGKT